MEVTKKEWTKRTTGLVDRVRKAIKKGRKTLKLETAADVFGYINLRPHLSKLGFATTLRYRNGVALVYLDMSVAKESDSMESPELLVALRALRPGTQECVKLTTPEEVIRWMNTRSSMRQQGELFRAARNCTSVHVWRLA